MGRGFALFLFAIAIANLIILSGVWRTYRYVHKGGRWVEADLNQSVGRCSAGLATPSSRPPSSRGTESLQTPRGRGQSSAGGPTPPIKGQFHRRSDEFLESIKKGVETPAENKIILHNFDVFPGAETHS